MLITRNNRNENNIKKKVKADISVEVIAFKKEV